jgi:putative FmdB family regulatory protein
MPTYEYECTKCGHHFDQFQSMRDLPLKKCPKCHRSSLKRLVGGGAGLIFKGSGFYITDYRKPGQTRPSEGESKPASDANPAAPSKPSKGPAEGGAKAAPPPAASPKK